MNRELITRLAGTFVLGCMMVAASASIMGCETTEGAGRDVEKLGDKIEDAAQDAKD